MIAEHSVRSIFTPRPAARDGSGPLPMRIAMNRLLYPSLFIIGIVALGLNGCGSTTTTEPARSATTPTADDHDEHMDHGDHHDGDHHDENHGGHSKNGPSAMEKMKAQLAKMSREDAAAAERQHFCPVSGEMLGTMGAPLAVEIKGQRVWLCCDGCKDQLLENPDEYLAKLKK